MPKRNLGLDARHKGGLRSVASRQDLCSSLGKSPEGPKHLHVLLLHTISRFLFAPQPHPCHLINCLVLLMFKIY